MKDLPEFAAEYCSHEMQHSRRPEPAVRLLLTPHQLMPWINRAGLYYSHTEVTDGSSS